LPEAELRSIEGGSEPFLTDEGHYILDAQIPRGTAPADLDRALKQVPGVVDHGLFLDMAELALLGHEDGTVERLERG
jgi:ribose 5-phosphate isomerase A